MRRRDFISISSGIAGFAVPDWASGEVTPCPPPTLQVGNAQPVSAVCGVKSSVPAWFASMSPNTWAAVGSNSLAKVQFAPLVYNRTYSGLRLSGVLAYSGATTDETRKELLVCGNGGHSDYLGNEGYACALWADVPYWYRLNDPTPASFIYDATTNGNVVDGTSRFFDGRSTSMHTYGIQTFANGKVWYQFQGHQTGGAGSWVHGVCSYHRDALRFGSEPGKEATGAVPHPGVADPGPWEFYGAVNDTPHAVPSAGSNQFSNCTSLLDETTGFIWTIAPKSPGLYYTRLDSRNGSHACYDQSKAGGGAPAYIDERIAPCLVHDRPFKSKTNGVIVVLHRNSANILLLSVPQMGRSSSVPIWSVKSPGGARPPLTMLGGASVYYNGAIYYMNWTEHGSKLFKLTLPGDLDNGDWSNAWSVISNEGAANAPATGIFPNDKTQTKFRIIRDMGGGHAALICLDEHAGPLKVYKL